MTHRLTHEEFETKLRSIREKLGKAISDNDAESVPVIVEEFHALLHELTVIEEFKKPEAACPSV